MKISNYNTYSFTSKGCLCFNSINESYVLISEKVYEKLQKGEFENITPSVLANLISNGIVIEDGYDEYKELTKEYDDAIHNNVYHLTLLPSLDCNLRCWYCFEKHIKGSRLTQEVQDKIFAHVKYMYENKKIDTIYLELFGGEPLLYFEQEVYPLLKKIQEYALQNDKGLAFFAVTNGLCINVRNINLFKDLNMNFQISIDGFRESHDKVKKEYKTKEPTYDKIVEIIKLIANSYKAFINLRINFDDKTLPLLDNIIQDLDAINRQQIIVHLERIWQTEHSESQGTPIKDIIDRFLSKGFIVSYMNFSRKSYSCKVSKPNQIVISYDGNIYKCTGRDFTTDNIKGYLENDGSVKWTKSVDERLSIITYDNEKCKVCKFLPLCWGPCCQKLMEHPKQIERFCPLNHMEMNMDEYIMYRFNNAMLLQNQGR